MINEGYIKFQCVLQKAESPAIEIISEMNKYRSKLFGMNLIGKYDSGISYGNISTKTDGGKIIISGTNTGGIETLEGKHYSTVEEYNIEQNLVVCSGIINASSETLTHAAVYECSSGIRCVIHIHNLQAWKILLNKIPTTSEKVEYGTPEMANEIKRLFSESNLPQSKILVMAGHSEGILAFGSSFDEIMKNIGGSVPTS